MSADGLFSGAGAQQDFISVAIPLGQFFGMSGRVPLRIKSAISTLFAVIDV